jgi:hypothetical protein
MYGKIIYTASVDNFCALLIACGVLNFLFYSCVKAGPKSCAFVLREFTTNFALP